MKIVIFGITGRVGANIAREALHRGHEVIGINKRPERGLIRVREEGAKFLGGDIYDYGTLERHAAELKDCGAFVVAVEADVAKPEMYTDGLKNVVRLAKEVNAKHIVFICNHVTVMVDDTHMRCDFMNIRHENSYRALACIPARGYFDALEDVSFTCVYFPTGIEFYGPRTEKIEVLQEPVDIDVFSSADISAADLAVFVLNEAESPAYAGKSVAVIGKEPIV